MGRNGDKIKIRRSLRYKIKNILKFNNKDLYNLDNNEVYGQISRLSLTNDNHITIGINCFVNDLYNIHHEKYIPIIELQFRMVINYLDEIETILELIDKLRESFVDTFQYLSNISSLIEISVNRAIGLSPAIRNFLNKNKYRKVIRMKTKKNNINEPDYQGLCMFVRNEIIERGLDEAKDFPQYYHAIMNAKEPELVYYGNREDNRWSIEDEDTNTVIVDHQILDTIVEEKEDDKNEN